MMPSTDAARAPPLDELENLQLMRDYAEREPWVGRVFTSRSSLRWFVSQHANELQATGAVVKLSNGRNAVHRHRFPATVSKILGVAL
jgi:hypothetical protein